MEFIVTRTNTSDELYHHGVKGMKWGVRRYRNKDGSLTPAGKRKYSSMSNDKLQKDLYKQVKKARSEQSDWSNRWNVNNTIGKYSKAAQEKYNKERKNYHESEDWKKAEKAWKKLDEDIMDGKIDPDTYDKEYEKIRKSVYRAELDSSVVYNNGRKYSEEYLNSYGKELNIGYLKDLGYDDKTAREFTERILKANKKLLNGM